MGIFIGAPYGGLLLALSGVVPQTDSKGVLWKAFAYFRPFTKGSARPGMRGRPAQAEIPCGGYPLKICSSPSGKSSHGTGNQPARHEGHALRRQNSYGEPIKTKNIYKIEGCFRVRTTGARATNGARSRRISLSYPATYVQA